METDDDMRRIMKPIISHFFNHDSVKTVSQDLFIPRGHLTKVFFQKMITVLTVKRILIYNRWEKLCASSCFNALSSHEMYLRYVMFACESEIRISSNIFENVLSACALVVNFNIETLINSGVDFRELSVDIFMAFYKYTLKKSFYKQGGFEKFAEYLRHHEYLPWENYMSNDHDSYARKSFLRNLFDRTKKEIEKYPYTFNSIEHNDVIENTNCEFMAKEVLSSTKIKLPTLTNSTDLEARLNAAWQQKMALRAAVSKRETKTESIKSEMSEFAEHEMTTASSKRETTTPFAKRQTAKTVTIRKESKADFKSEVTERDSKRKSMDASSKREVTKIFLQGCENSESTFKTNNAVERKSGLDWCENIVQRVVKYNSLKCSNLADANNRTGEAGKALNDLKNKLTCLIDALDNCDE